MSPSSSVPDQFDSAGNAILRDVGPTEVDQAGDLAGSAMDFRNQGQQLIQHIALAKPAQLTTWGSWPEDTGRTLNLDLDEVESAIESADWSDEIDVGKILGARVHGKGKAEDEKVVIVLFELEPSGRVSRGAVGYGDLSKSQKAYQEAVKSGRYREGQEGDIEAMRSSLQTAQGEIQNLQRQLATRGSEGVPAPATTPGSPEHVDVPEGKAADVVEAVESGDLTDEQLEALKQRDDRKSVQDAIEKQQSGD